MSIASLASKLISGTAWTSVISLVVEYGPGLYRKAKEHFKPDTITPAEAGDVQQDERISRLERLLLEQESVIRKQVADNELLQERCKLLEERLRFFRIVIGILAPAATVFLALILYQR